VKKFLVIVVLSLGLAVPAFAQDAPDVTEEPTAAPTEVVVPEEPPVVVEPPVEAPLSSREIVVVLALGAVTILASFFAVQIGSIVRTLISHQPPLVQELIRTNTGRLLDEVDKQVKSTPTLTDDELFARLRPFIESLVSEQVEMAVRSARPTSQG